MQEQMGRCIDKELFLPKRVSTLKGLSLGTLSGWNSSNKTIEYNLFMVFVTDIVHEKKRGLPVYP